MTRDSVWVAVDELFDRKRFIEAKVWKSIQEASRFFGKMLRHGENASWAPERDKVGAISAELAFNVGILCGKMYKEQTRSDLFYGFCKLEQKDFNRPRFHVLVREPSRTELNDASARKYMIIGGPLNGKLLLRIRSVQGHSGARAQHMTRINQRLVPKVEFPTLLMHSTKSSLLESIGLYGLQPGGHP